MEASQPTVGMDAAGLILGLAHERMGRGPRDLPGLKPVALLLPLGRGLSWLTADPLAMAASCLKQKGALPSTASCLTVSWMGVTSGMSSTLPKLYDTTVPTEVTTNKCVRFYTGKLTPLIVVTSVFIYLFI